MDKYQQIEVIGKGSFGTVKKIMRKSDKEMFVSKEIIYVNLDHQQKQQLVSEVNILKELKHPNIIRYEDRIIDSKNSTLYLITEYCSKGDLSQRLRLTKQNGLALPEDIIWKVFFQLILALHYCHTRKAGKILHRDIKPANIFVDSNHSIKLGDFGLSRQMGEDSLFAVTHVGTPYYMSPEQILYQKYNQKSDIWSAGCLLYELASLRRPFQGTNTLELYDKIKEGKFQRIPMNYSENLHQLICQMLHTNSQKRIDTTTILKLPIMEVRVKESELKQYWSRLKRKQNCLNSKKIALLEQLHKVDEQLAEINDGVEMNDRFFMTDKDKLEEKTKIKNDSLINNCKQSQLGFRYSEGKSFWPEKQNQNRGNQAFFQDNEKHNNAIHTKSAH